MKCDNGFYHCDIDGCGRSGIPLAPNVPGELIKLMDWGWTVRIVGHVDQAYTYCPKHRNR